MMRAMLMSRQAPISSRPLELSKVPVPVPLAGEVLVRIEACAVCRTDLHVIEGDLKDPKIPLIPGHQAVGRVFKLGEGANKFKIGDRVGIAWLRSTCGVCRWCATGKENLCESSRYTGYHADGGYAEFAVIDQRFAYLLPSEGRASNIAPLLCAGIIGYRALKRAEVPDGGKLGLIGFGSSAHITMQVAKARGCKVYVSTHAAEHQKLASQMGAYWTGGAGEAFPDQLDSVIVFAPVGDVVPSALRSVRKAGIVAMAGIHSTPVPELNYNECIFHEKVLTSVESNTRQDGIELLSYSTHINTHITEYSLEDANTALIELKDDRICGTAVIIMN